MISFSPQGGATSIAKLTTSENRLLSLESQLALEIDANEYRHSTSTTFIFLSRLFYFASQPFTRCRKEMRIGSEGASLLLGLPSSCEIMTEISSPKNLPSCAASSKAVTCQHLFCRCMCIAESSRASRVDFLDFASDVQSNTPAVPVHVHVELRESRCTSHVVLR